MCKTLKLTARFAAPPEAVYELLADAALRSAVTGRDATISPVIGGAFETDGGAVRGINVDLVPGKRLVQAWRHADFPDGVYSMASFVFTPTANGGTEVVLTHRGVPKALLDRTEAAWRDDHFAPMRAWLSRKTRGTP